MFQLRLHLAALAVLLGACASGDRDDGIPQNDDRLSAEERKPLVLGMYNNTAIAPGTESASAANFRAVADEYFVGGKTKVHRVFNTYSNFPDAYGKSAGGQDPASGNVSFLSVKPPNDDIKGVIDGAYDAKISSLARSMPDGSYLTMYHEPENDMDGPTFVKLFRHFYAVAKEANPNVLVGYIAMDFQWREGSASTKNPDDWWIGADATDYLAIDAYIRDWKPIVDLSQQADFQRWYKWALPKGKPILITEYSIVLSKKISDSRRADLIRKSLDYVWSQPEIRMVLWWNQVGNDEGVFQLSPTTSARNGSPLALEAWNEKVKQYGSSNASISEW
ncbi:hypothetical protein LZC95_12040 [Pendulispora brunnea]|uniref:GH26 domain-containing protein n=1 Tax=Pendulispora brunnea TaxID=2905690 RepID=A0ABZ2KFT7_9BACT